MKFKKKIEIAKNRICIKIPKSLGGH